MTTKPKVESRKSKVENLQPPVLKPFDIVGGQVSQPPPSAADEPYAKSVAALHRAVTNEQERKTLVFRAMDYDRLSQQLAEVTQQRDELSAALRKLLADGDSLSDPISRKQAQDEARAAISRAEGKQ
jgi:hypothetical protein